VACEAEIFRVGWRESLGGVVQCLHVARKERLQVVVIGRLESVEKYLVVLFDHVFELYRGTRS